MKNYIKKIKTSNTFRLWNLLFVSALIGIIMMHVVNYVPDYKISSAKGRTFDEEKKMLYFYFTFQSNFMALLFSTLIILNTLKLDSIHSQRLKTLMLTSLFITSLVFWTMIFPAKGIKGYNSTSFFSTFMVHTVTPIIAIITFVFETIKEKTLVKITYKNTLLLHGLYPILWIIVAIILYFVWGANYKSSIYAFMDIKNQSVVKTISYFVGIIFLFFVSSAGFIWLVRWFNKKIKRYN